MSGKQRFFTRHPITLRVRVRTTKGWIEMETGDISRRGVFIRTDEPLDEHKIAQLRLTMPNGRELDAMGHVRRVVRDPATADHGMGIEFFVMSKEAEEEWDRFVLDQSRSASTVSSMLLAVDVNQQPSGSAQAADRMVELPVVRESVEALLPQSRRASAMVNEPTMVATGADARGPLVVAHDDAERPSLVAKVRTPAHDERSVYLADVHAETFPAWESGGIEAASGSSAASPFAEVEARPPTLPTDDGDFEDEDLPWAPAPARTPSATSVAARRDLEIGPPPLLDEEPEEATVLARASTAAVVGTSERAEHARTRSLLRNAGQDLQRPGLTDLGSTPSRRTSNGPGGTAARDQIEDAPAPRAVAPRAAGAAVANAKPRPSAIQGPTVATGSSNATSLPSRQGAAAKATMQPAGTSQPAGASPLASQQPAPQPQVAPTSRGGVDRPGRPNVPDSPASGQPAGPVEGNMAPVEGGGIFITVRPGDVEHLRQFIDRRIRQANVFLRSTVACAPGQPVEVAVVHPNTDAEVIVSGTVARVIRGETEAESGFLLRFADLEPQLEASLLHFVETGHPEVRAPTAVSGDEQHDLRQAAETATDSADAWILYGWSLLAETENPEEAIDAFQRALMMAPERAEIHDGLALAYALAGETAKSYAFLRSSRQLAQSSQS